MDKYAFISYSHKDKIFVDMICSELTNRKVKYWIAHRDIRPGDNWAGSIIKAINTAEIMILIFSSHSNISIQVRREVERAISKDIKIVPFRIENVKLTEEMEYFISSCHWLDGFTNPKEKHISHLCDEIAKILPPPDKWWKEIDRGMGGEDAKIECVSCGYVKIFERLFGEGPSNNCQVCGFDGVIRPKRDWYVVARGDRHSREIYCRKCRSFDYIYIKGDNFISPEKCEKCGHF